MSAQAAAALLRDQLFEAKTHLVVFNLALEQIDDPGMVRRLRIAWERASDVTRWKELMEEAVAEEYFPGRFCLRMGPEHWGDAWLVDDPGDNYRRFRVTFLRGGTDFHYVDTIEEAKALMVLRYRTTGICGPERVGT